jgi:peptide-methionine (R)-S-oxide reductase
MNRKAIVLAAFPPLIYALTAMGYPQEPRSRTRTTPKPALDSKRTKADDPTAPSGKVIKSDAEWRKQLTPAQYMVTRRKATEPAFSGRYAVGHFKGIFTCVCCGADLFSSTHKYNSGTGWPSFYRPLRADVLEQEMDYSAVETRVEVMCARCGAHLGHVFADGPPPTGLRFCINSVALKLKTPTVTPKAKAKAKSKPPTKAETKASVPEVDEPGDTATP